MPDADRVYEFRIRAGEDRMVEIIRWIDHMKLGELPEAMSTLLAVCSDVTQWHEVETEERSYA